MMVDEATSGAEYRASRRKLITLPSGDKFLLKKPGRTALVELMDIFGDQIASGEFANMDFEELMDTSAKNKLTPEQLAQLIDTLFRSCVLKPTIVFEITDNDHEVWIEDIDPLDTIELLKQIFDWIDLSSERIKSMFFRGGKLVGEDDRSGSKVPRDETVQPP